MKTSNRHERIQNITKLAMFIAIEAIICFVPFLGSIQIGPVVATLAMIPVIIVGMTYGVKYGSILGFCAGLFSFIWWTFVDSSNPSALLFTPWNGYTSEYRNYWPIVICFVPRILTGTVSGLLASYFKKICKSKVLLASCYLGVGILSSLVNTILVLFGTYLLWGKNYASLAGMEYNILLKTIMGIVLTNGIFEALVGGIVGSAVTFALTNIKK
ncbi:MAG: ECF transporter S component [Bacilli bacterium]|nr:ECF transporter S component [Mollicutes bacterium]MDY3899566.1 ECF transporter S component [Bacilli bacterium]